MCLFNGCCISALDDRSAVELADWCCRRLMTFHGVYSPPPPCHCKHTPTYRSKTIAIKEPPVIKSTALLQLREHCNEIHMAAALAAMTVVRWLPAYTCVHTHHENNNT